jgi:hypothetical protein
MLGGPCLEGTLQKLELFRSRGFRIKPRGRGDWDVNPYKTLDAGRARELQKCAQPATHMLSVNCLYQMNVKKRKGVSIFSLESLRIRFQPREPLEIALNDTIRCDFRV